jgi:hypothetical protein
MTCIRAAMIGIAVAALAVEFRNLAAEGSCREGEG